MFSAPVAPVSPVLSVVSLGEYEIYWFVLAGFVAVMVVGTIVMWFKK